MRRAVPALLLATLLAPSLAACSDDSPTPPYDPRADAVTAIQHTLRQRARAIVARDSVAFDRTLAPGHPGFRGEQDQYFHNLAQLPLGMLRFDLAEKTLKPDGDAYWGEVTIRLRLQGYDAAPVVTHDRWRFVPTRNQRRYLLASTTDPRWEASHHTQPQPWDLGGVDVRREAGVLGIFDDTTVGSAEEVLRSVSESELAVRDVLPPDLDRAVGVVVYTLADQSYVDSLSGLPVGDPGDLDGATVPVPRNDDDPEGPVASYRIVLNPSVIYQDPGPRDRLVRHELTHVALGARARGVPLWLTEGLAEYVSVQPMLPSERQLQPGALDLVASGVSDLPTDADFSGDQAEAWYAIAWWVCEYVARTRGRDALWALLDALHGGADQQSAVEDQLGMTTSELARSGVDLMRSVYG